MFTLNLGLDNKEVYEGCEMKEVGGRLTLVTKPQDAMQIVGRNITKMVNAEVAKPKDPAVDAVTQVMLTGAMAVWVYLIAEHIVLHRFNELWYTDGLGNIMQIAQH